MMGAGALPQNRWGVPSTFKMARGLPGERMHNVGLAGG